MNLNDVDLQEATGFPIVQGCLSIGSEAFSRKMGIPKHDRVLFRFPSWIDDWTDLVEFWPAVDVTRNDHGFSETKLGRFGLAFRKLNLPKIDNQPLPDGGTPRFLTGLIGAGLNKLGLSNINNGSLLRKSDPWFLRGGVGVGNLAYQFSPFTAFSPVSTPIRDYKLKVHFDVKGMKLVISGTFAADDNRAATLGNRPNISGKKFYVVATIPWAAMVLKNFKFAGAHWQFGGQASRSDLDKPERPRISQKLQNLIIREGGWPVIKGRVVFDPEVIWPTENKRRHSPFVTIHFDHLDDQRMISFRNAPNVEMLKNGFARCWDFDRELSIYVFGRRMLENHFMRRDLFSMELSGDDLGSVRYKTGYGTGHSDPLRWIHQQIKTMSFRALLDKSGLKISVNGELDDFEPAEFSHHKEQKNSQLIPVQTYTLEATMPWALIVARGFRFARRIRDF